MNDESDFNFVHKPRDVMAGEPECILKWRREQEERIRIKDQQEEEKKKELREKAKKDLEDW